MTLPEEAWKSIAKPDIVQKEDGTFITQGAIVNEFETMLSEGADINDIIRKLNGGQ
jgi:hypothetical protein